MPDINPDALKEEGLALFSKGEPIGAMVRFEKAAEAYGAAGDAAGQAEMYNNIGVIYRLRRDWPAAVSALGQAEKGFAELNDDQRRAQVLGNLGDVYASSGERDLAVRYYGDSVELFAVVGDGDKQSQVLRAYSLMRLRQRQWLEAMELMAKSLEARPRKNLFQHLFYRAIRFALKLLMGK